jgi:hypothetical protein
VVTDAGHNLVPGIERAWAELAEEAMGEAGAEQREIALTTLEQANDRLRGASEAVSSPRTETARIPSAGRTAPHIEVACYGGPEPLSQKAP